MLAVVVSVPAPEAELASEALWALGVAAVEERAVGDRVELWTALGDDRAQIARLLDEPASPVCGRWRFEEVDERVADTWRRFATPTRVDDALVVVPAWLEVPAEQGVEHVLIEPGATFGAGDHPTTVLSLRAMRAALQPSATVLDVGCGSGVLGVAAARLGAAAVVAIDISPASVPVTRHNATLNGVADRVDVSTTPLAEIEGAFDVVVANILAPTLIELAPDLARLTARGGSLVVSGVLDGRFDHVVAALTPLQAVRVDRLDGWAAVTLRR